MSNQKNKATACDNLKDSNFAENLGTDIELNNEKFEQWIKRQGIYEPA